MGGERSAGVDPATHAAKGGGELAGRDVQSDAGPSTRLAAEQLTTPPPDPRAGKLGGQLDCCANVLLLLVAIQAAREAPA